MPVERYEIWGHDVQADVAGELGPCECCGQMMRDGEQHECECDSEVCDDCMVICAGCDDVGCKSCMIYDDDSGEWFCITRGPDETRQSDCLDEWNKQGD